MGVVKEDMQRAGVTEEYVRDRLRKNLQSRKISVESSKNCSSSSGHLAGSKSCHDACFYM